MPRLSSVDRERTIGMLYSNIRPVEVARHFRVSHTTIHWLRECFQQTGATNDCPRSGMPPVMTPEHDRHRRLTHLRRRCRPATVTARKTLGRHRIATLIGSMRRRCTEVHQLNHGHTRYWPLGHAMGYYWQGETLFQFILNPIIPQVFDESIHVSYIYLLV